MKIAIMQPYFFPYIGYYQLINLVDVFYIYDDVNFIKRGWINRNQIQINGEPKYITVPLHKASQNKKIHEIEISQDSNWRNKILETIKHNYKKAPYFDDVFPLVENVLNYNSSKMYHIATESLMKMMGYLKPDHKVEYAATSPIRIPEEVRGQDRILEICKVHKEPLTYINPCGGKELYTLSAFEKEGFTLKFIQSKLDNNLSIIDILMHYSREEVCKFLNEFELL